MKTAVRVGLVLLAAAAMQGCASAPKSGAGAPPAHVTLDSQGVAAYAGVVVPINQLAAMLRRNGVGRQQEIRVHIPAGTPNRAAMGEILAALQHGGFRRVLFLEERRATSSVTE
jgi:type IV pilus biogenesis protein CpaD/CtpE